VGGLTVAVGVSRLGSWGVGSPLPGYPLDFNQVLAGLDPPTVRLLVAKSATPGVPVPVPVAVITLDTAAAEVDVQAAGFGGVSATGGGVMLDSHAFGNNVLQPFTLRAPRPDVAPIDTLVVFSAATAILGSIGIRIRPSGPIGTISAAFNPPMKDAPPAAPSAPASIVRHRQAEVVTSGGAPSLQPQSMVEVHWPAPATPPPDDPLTVPPPPNLPIGFVAERNDSGAGPAVRLRQHITPTPQPTPTDSPLNPKPAQCYRFVDPSVADPKGSLTYRVAGFDSFGALGAFSPSGAPLAITPAAPLPSSVRIRRFDNTAASGGAAAAGGWQGGRITGEVQWSGPSLVAYPDARTWRLAISSPDVPSPGMPTADDQDLPAPQVLAVTVTKITLESGGTIVQISTNPALPAIAADDPLPLLVLAGVSPTTGASVVERYGVRPAVAAGASVVTATILLGQPMENTPPASRLVANPDTFLKQPAYLVRGLRLPIDRAVPILVPVDRAPATVRGRVAAVASVSKPFVWPASLPKPDDPIIPSFPAAAQATFVAPQPGSSG
jgi:hypothetical protein